jgi:hypothetical protein
MSRDLLEIPADPAPDHAFPFVTVLCQSEARARRRTASLRERRGRHVKHPFLFVPPPIRVIHRRTPRHFQIVFKKDTRSITNSYIIPMYLTANFLGLSDLAQELCRSLSCLVLGATDGILSHPASTGHMAASGRSAERSIEARFPEIRKVRLDSSRKTRNNRTN